MQVRKQQSEPDMEQQAGSKLGKEYVKAVYCPSAYLTYMQSALCTMLDWMKHPRSFPASESFPMSQFFASGGQSIGVSASASVLPMNIQD